MKSLIFLMLIVRTLATPSTPSSTSDSPSQTRGYVVEQGQASDYRGAVQMGASFVYFHTTHGIRRPSDFNRLLGERERQRARQAGLMVGAIHRLTFQPGTGPAQASRFVENGGGWQSDGQQLPGVVLVPSAPACSGYSQIAMRQILAEFFIVYDLLTNRTPVLAITRRAWLRCFGDWHNWHELPINLFDWDAFPTHWEALPYPRPLQTYTFRRVNNICKSGTPRAPCACCVLFRGTLFDLQRFAEAPQHRLPPPHPAFPVNPTRPAFNSSGILSQQCATVLMNARTSMQAGASMPTQCQDDLSTWLNQEPQPGPSGYRPPRPKRPRLETQSGPADDADDSDTDLLRDELKE